ncbi:beta-microseminoprotein-like [Parambassis ranga]|uniref:Beta-microseminoprotein-like n=1 Tax=Parambassis ranga TaxID=210632 RepID=A0A6P7J273_9TELE|nr:beta-microseminoprotein-like [Parambassis ranga]
MRYLALAVLLCALLPLTNAQCFVKTVKPSMSHCKDDVDDTWHAVGSNWRNSKCWDCTCEGCCAGYSTPTSFPKDCESVFDPVACEYKVHKKGDPTVLCPIFGAVAK